MLRFRGVEPSTLSDLFRFSIKMLRSLCVRVSKMSKRYYGPLMIIIHGIAAKVLFWCERTWNWPSLCTVIMVMINFVYRCSGYILFLNSDIVFYFLFRNKKSNIGNRLTIFFYFTQMYTNWISKNMRQMHKSYYKDGCTIYELIK